MQQARSSSTLCRVQPPHAYGSGRHPVKAHDTVSVNVNLARSSILRMMCDVRDVRYTGQYGPVTSPAHTVSVDHGL